MEADFQQLPSPLQLEHAGESNGQHAGVAHHSVHYIVSVRSCGCHVATNLNADTVIEPDPMHCSTNMEAVVKSCDIIASALE